MKIRLCNICLLNNIQVYLIQDIYIVAKNFTKSQDEKDVNQCGHPRSLAVNGVVMSVGDMTLIM